MFDVQPITSPKQLDCGPTCLQMLLAYYGVEVDLDTLIKECNVTVAGCTGADLLRAGRLHGLDMQCWSMDADELVRQDRPAIVNWRCNHWCVFCGRDEDGRVSVCNPDRGRYRMSEGTFASLFSGLADHPGQGVAITNGEPK
jgi:ATP-binding cassette subfamily B protein